MIWTGTYPEFHPEVLGLIPSFLSESDPRPAKQQLDDNYRHGGGWHPTQGFRLDLPGGGKLISPYEEDMPLRPMAMSRLRDEVLIFYESSFLLILQLDGSFEVARVD